MLIKNYFVRLIEGEKIAKLRTQPSQRRIFRFDASTFFTQYRRLEDIHAFMDYLARQWPKLVTIDSIGKTYEGRDMRILRITGTGPGLKRINRRPKKVNPQGSTVTRSRQTTRSQGKRTSGKPILWLDAGIHAREWVAPPTALYTALYMLESYTNGDQQAVQILDTLELIVLPSANPDGYEYSHTYDRMWRKTRSVNANSRCRGVDPNRNFDYKWNTIGASSNPCDETYAGPRAFSEVETQAISNYILSHKDKIKVSF